MTNEIEMTTTIKAGSKVEGGRKGTDDYDVGEVIEIDGDQITVAWESGVRTTQSAELLTVVK